MKLILLFSAPLCLALLHGCFFEPGPLDARGCLSALDCAEGLVCVEGFCQRDGSTCQRDEECDDGIFCNGQELCRPGWALADGAGCLRSEPPALDDGIDCTFDVCDLAQDRVLHIPTVDCECVVDGDCPVSEESCRVTLCTEALTCIETIALVETECDDEVQCTRDDRCDASGRCAGQPSDADCDDGLFCNGAERCDGARGCLAGQAPEPSEEVPECASVVCDEATDRLVRQEQACFCALDSDCNQPCAATATCAAGRCVNTFLPEGSACDDQDGLACTQGRCSAAGACAPFADDTLCEGVCREEARCLPGERGADQAGCVFIGLADGQTCQSSCAEQAVCGSGACRAVTPPGTVEGPGLLNCGNGRDDDCDGLTDGADLGCARPDLLEISAAGRAPAGLDAEGAVVELRLSRAGEPLTDQAPLLFCSGAAQGPSIDFGEADVFSALGSDPQLRAYDPSGVETVVLGDRLVAGVPFVLDDPSSPLGARLCSGAGLSFGPFEMPPLTSPVRTFQISVTAGSPGGRGLTDAWLVVSYRTQNALNGGSFVPLVAIDGSDTELETHTFAVRNGGGVGTLEVRVDVVGAGPSGVAGACGFVKEISLYEVLNPVGEGLRRPNWLVGGAEEAALEVFSGGRDPAEIMVAEPGLEHELDLSQEAATTDASGVRWRAQSAGAPAGASLEFPRPVSGVTFAPGSPLYLDLNVALVQGLAARGEVVHLQGSAGEGVAPRKFASALPGGDLPPHLTSAYRFIDRTMVLLPVEARRLTGTRLSFTHTALASGAAVYFDSLFLYFHDAQASAEVVAEAARGGPGRALHTVRLRSARRGPVSVRCHWLGAAGPALSSSALTLVFE